MLLGLYQVRKDRLFAQCLARLKAMQTLHEDEALAIAPDLDWSRLPDLKHALRNLSHRVGLKRRTALYRHINPRNRQLFASHHGPGPPSNARKRSREPLCRGSYPAFGTVAIDL